MLLTACTQCTAVLNFRYTEYVQQIIYTTINGLAQVCPNNLLLRGEVWARDYFYHSNIISALA